MSQSMVSKPNKLALQPKQFTFKSLNIQKTWNYLEITTQNAINIIINVIIVKHIDNSTYKDSRINCLSCNA